MASPAAPRGKLIFLVTEDWYFWSHRLPMARAAQRRGLHVAVATRVAAHGERIWRRVSRCTRCAGAAAAWDWARASPRSAKSAASIAASGRSWCTMSRSRRRSRRRRGALARVPGVVSMIAGTGYLASAGARGAARRRASRDGCGRSCCCAAAVASSSRTRTTAPPSPRCRPNAAWRIAVIRGSGVDLDAFSASARAARAAGGGRLCRAHDRDQGRGNSRRGAQRCGVAASRSGSCSPARRTPRTRARSIAGDADALGGAAGVAGSAISRDVRAVWARRPYRRAGLARRRRLAEDPARGGGDGPADRRDRRSRHARHRAQRRERDPGAAGRCGGAGRCARRARRDPGGGGATARRAGRSSRQGSRRKRSARRRSRSMTRSVPRSAPVQDRGKSDRSGQGSGRPQAPAIHARRGRARADRP